MPAVICPDCGSQMVLRTTKKFTYRSGSPRKFYGCSRWPDCKSAHGAHPDGKPVGTPGTLAVKQARMVAHAAFDKLWKPPSMLSRFEAYGWLAEQLGMTRHDCHIGAFDEATCTKVVEVCAQRLGVDPATLKPQPYRGSTA